MRGPERQRHVLVIAAGPAVSLAQASGRVQHLRRIVVAMTVVPAHVNREGRRGWEHQTQPSSQRRCITHLDAVHSHSEEPSAVWDPGERCLLSLLDRVRLGKSRQRRRIDAPEQPRTRQRVPARQSGDENKHPSDKEDHQVQDQAHPGQQKPERRQEPPGCLVPPLIEAGPVAPGVRRGRSLRDWVTNPPPRKRDDVPALANGG